MSDLDQASREKEKRSVGVFHELFSLSLHKRIGFRMRFPPLLLGIRGYSICL